MLPLRMLAVKTLGIIDHRYFNGRCYACFIDRWLCCNYLKKSPPSADPEIEASFATPSVPLAPHPTNAVVAALTSCRIKSDRLRPAVMSRNRPAGVDFFDCVEGGLGVRHGWRLCFGCDSIDVGSYPDGERTAIDVGEIRRREMGGQKGGSIERQKG
jgi:hypothetical protein